MAERLTPELADGGDDSSELHDAIRDLIVSHRGGAIRYPQGFAYARSSKTADVEIEVDGGEDHFDETYDVTITVTRRERKG